MSSLFLSSVFFTPFSSTSRKIEALEMLILSQKVEKRGFDCSKMPYRLKSIFLVSQLRISPVPTSHSPVSSVLPCRHALGLLPWSPDFRLLALTPATSPGLTEAFREPLPPDVKQTNKTKGRSPTIC